MQCVRLKIGVCNFGCEKLKIGRDLFLSSLLIHLQSSRHPPRRRKRPHPLLPTELAAAHPALADAARLAAPWLQRAAVAALGAALAAEAALVALVPTHRADAWQLPMLLALLWQAGINLAAHPAAADAN